MVRNLIGYLILFFLLGLLSCGSSSISTPTAADGEKALAEYYQKNNPDIKVISFSDWGGEIYKSKGILYYKMAFKAELQQPYPDCGIIIRTIEGKLSFYKSPDVAKWNLEKGLKIEAHTRETTVEVNEARVKLIEKSPVYGISCPYNPSHFLWVTIKRCPDCLREDREIKLIWADELKCFECDRTGRCPYCDESPEKSSMRCLMCKGTGECGVCTPLGTPGKDIDTEGTIKECKYCHGTGKCSYCKGTGITCHMCNSAQKCRFCKGQRILLRKDFDQEGRLLKP